MGFDTAPYTAYDLLTCIGSIVTEAPMSLQEFTDFAERFPQLIAEREASGKVIIMSPVKFGSAENEGHFFGYVYAWNLTNNKPGIVFSPSGGFQLLGEEVRSSDTAWMSNERLKPLLADPTHRKKWITACPEFVVEVKSDSDRIAKLKEKMVDSWLANGLLLGWVIDPDEEVAYIYRQGQTEPEEVRDFARSMLSGEDVLPGFRFPLAELG